MREALSELGDRSGKIGKAWGDRTSGDLDFLNRVSGDSRQRGEPRSPPPQFHPHSGGQRPLPDAAGRRGRVKEILHVRYVGVDLMPMQGRTEADDKFKFGGLDIRFRQAARNAGSARRDCLGNPLGDSSGTAARTVCTAVIDCAVQPGTAAGPEV